MKKPPTFLVIDTFMSKFWNAKNRDLDKQYELTLTKLGGENMFTSQFHSL